MKLSLRFCFGKLTEKYEDMQMTVLSGDNPQFSSVGILSDRTITNTDILYFDLLQNRNSILPKGDIASSLSVVTTAGRVACYEYCNRIIMPDEIAMDEVLTFISNLFSKYFQWSDSIYDAISKNHGLQEIVDLSVPMIGNPMYFADSSWKMLAQYSGDLHDISATWRYQEKYGYLPFQVMQKIIDAGELHIMNKREHAFWIDSEGFVIPFICKPIRNNGKHYGYFFIIELYDKTTACDIELADYLGNVVATSVYNTQAYLEQSDLYHAHFIVDVIEGTLTDVRLIRDQMQALPFSGDRDFVLFLVKVGSHNVIQHMLSRFSNEIPCLCVPYKDRIVGIVSYEQIRKNELEEYLKKFSRQFQFQYAFSEDFSELTCLKQYYEQAQFALQQISDSERHSIRYMEVYLLHLCQQCEPMIPEFDEVRKLREYDGAHGTEYCDTLYTWLTCERNHVVAARKLFIHRNTLRYRLENIFHLIDVDTEVFDVRLRLILSLYRNLRGDAHDSGS